MTHYPVLVILEDTDIKNVGESDVEEPLEPFNEQLEVPAYVRECYCTTRKARHDSEDMAWKKLGKTIDDMRKDFDKLHPLPEDKDKKFEAIMSDEREEAWDEFMKPFYEIKKQIYDTLPKEPEKDCDECFGSGKYKSRYNKNSKWDWYAIGGRWDGWMGKGNIVKVGALLKNKDPRIPTAILTPDGEWHEQGEVGWFGSINRKMKRAEWDKYVLELYAKFKNNVGVLVDCHI